MGKRTDEIGDYFLKRGQDEIPVFIVGVGNAKPRLFHDFITEKNYIYIERSIRPTLSAHSAPFFFDFVNYFKQLFGR